MVRRYKESDMKRTLKSAKTGGLALGLAALLALAGWAAAGSGHGPAGHRGHGAAVADNMVCARWIKPPGETEPVCDLWIKPPGESNRLAPAQVVAVALAEA